MITYTIKKGDTLSEIAERYDTTVQVLCNINGIKTPNRIYPGHVIRIPEPVPAPAPAPEESREEKIGKALVSCLEDLQKLESYNALEELLSK